MAWEAKTMGNHGVRKLWGQKQESNAYPLEQGWEEPAPIKTSPGGRRAPEHRQPCLQAEALEEENVSLSHPDTSAVSKCETEKHPMVIKLG